ACARIAACARTAAARAVGAQPPRAARFGARVEAASAAGRSTTRAAGAALATAARVPTCAGVGRRRGVPRVPDAHPDLAALRLRAIRRGSTPSATSGARALGIAAGTVAVLGAGRLRRRDARGSGGRVRPQAAFPVLAVPVALARLAARREQAYETIF